VSRKLPRWEDTAAVARRVRDELELETMEFEFHPLGKIPGVVPPMSDAKFAAKEQQAVTAVKENGDLRPLLDMIEPWPFMVWPVMDRTPHWVNPDVSRLSPATWALVCDLLSGKLKLPPQLGRPQMDKAVRRRINRRLDDAADNVDSIVCVLTRLYPTKRETHIKSKAIDIAAKWHDADRKLLADRVPPSKRDRRTTS
jgi:hypothetical protein